MSYDEPSQMLEDLLGRQKQRFNKLSEAATDAALRSGGIGIMILFWRELCGVEAPQSVCKYCVDRTLKLQIFQCLRSSD